MFCAAAIKRLPDLRALDCVEKAGGNARSSRTSGRSSFNYSILMGASWSCARLLDGHSLEHHAKTLFFSRSSTA
jgi:hypothetical protein